MTNIVKKIKNVNPLAMFAKLVGLAVVFSVVSCGCKDKDNVTFKFTAEPTEITEGKEDFQLKVEVSEGVAKLEEYTLEVKEIKCFSEANYSDGSSKPVDNDKKLVVASDIKGKTLKALLKDTVELKKGDAAKNIDVTLDPKGTQSAEITFVIKKGSDEKTTATVKWTIKK